MHLPAGALARSSTPVSGRASRPLLFVMRYSFVSRLSNMSCDSAVGVIGASETDEQTSVDQSQNAVYVATNSGPTCCTVTCFVSSYLDHPRGAVVS